LPFGITLIAQEGSDNALLKLASQWQVLFELSLGISNIKGTSEEHTILEATKNDVTQIAVVGAHLSGLPLNWQLTERRSRLVKVCKTAKSYRLFALPNTHPPKPGLVKCPSDGVSIELEVYEMPSNQLGSFLNLIPPPLGLGNIELEDGSLVKGFICEQYAVHEAQDISNLGGWKSYINQL
jgi:allophanate hydrolase